MSTEHSDVPQENPYFSTPWSVVWGVVSGGGVTIGIRICRLLIIPPHHPLLSMALGLWLLSVIALTGWSSCQAVAHMQRQTKRASSWIRYARNFMNVGVVLLAAAALCALFLKNSLE